MVDWLNQNQGLISVIGLAITSLGLFIGGKKVMKKYIKSGDNSVNVNTDGDVNIGNVNIGNTSGIKEDPDLVKIVKEIIENKNHDVEKIAKKLQISLEEVEDHLDELNDRDVIRTLSGGIRKVREFQILNNVKLKKIIKGE